MNFKKYKDLYLYATIGCFRTDDYRGVKLIKSAVIKGYECRWSLLITNGYNYRDITSFTGNTTQAKEYAWDCLVKSQIKMVS